MSRELAGARLARWWVERYSATAPDPEGADRRAELRADVHDQVVEARERGLSGREVSLALAGRVARGVPGDILWRLRVERAPGRLEWHLANPSTVLGALLVLLVPAALLLDASHGSAPSLAVVSGIWTALVLLLSSCAIGFAIVAGVRRLTRPRSFLRGIDPDRIRRTAVCWMCTLFATAAIWRFGAGPLSGVAAAAWAGFGIALVVYLSAVTATAARRFRDRILDIRKVPS